MKILVIEDDRSLRDLLKVHLGARGHNVQIAADAAADVVVGLGRRRERTEHGAGALRAGHGRRD